jgi:hypothetical protein
MHEIRFGTCRDEPISVEDVLDGSMNRRARAPVELALLTPKLKWGSRPIRAYRRADPNEST